MNRIESAFKSKAFVAYLTMGQTSLNDSFEQIEALHRGGANIIELGVPFSDPVADGPVIQKAAQQALDHGVTLSGILTLVKKIREKFPALALVLFSYYNPILNAGYTVYQEFEKAGIDGILIVDLPLEESKKHVAACREHHIAPIQIISSVTPEKRMKMIAEQGDGFIYYACRKGITGMKIGLPDNYSTQIAAIKRTTDLPIATGFGISNKEIAADVLAHADGFVVGSYFVSAITENANLDDLTKLAQQIDPRNRP
jgi:tryptophan synthase alpha chain